MGFEAPLALLGLVAVGLPVAAHLLRKKDLRRLTLPTIALLERAQAHARRRMRVVDLLLLALRVTLVSLLAVGVAGPFVASHLAGTEGQVAALAIVLDDSMSMSRRAPGGTLLDAARERAVTLVQDLPEGSEVAVVLAGAPVRILVPRTTDLASAERALAEVASETARGTALAPAVTEAQRQLGGARHALRRVALLSDFAHHARPDDLPDLAGGIRLEVEALGAGTPGANVAVVDATASPDPSAPDRVVVRVEARGVPEGTELPVRLEQAGATLATGTLVGRRGVARAAFGAPLPDGDPVATVRVEADDVLPADDARGVLLRSPAALRLLLVDGDPHPSRDQDEVGYLARALDAASQDMGGVSYRVVDADGLDARALSGVDVVVLANVPTPRPVVARQLTELVDRGGGLLVCAGDRVRPRELSARLGPLLPTRLGAAVDSAAPLGLADAETSDVVPAGGVGLGAVQTRRRILLDPPPAGSRSVLAFEDGTPALVLGRYGEGRTAVLATTVDDDWGDLPLRPGFLPLLTRLLLRLSPVDVVPDRALAAGDTARLPMPPGTGFLRVTTPTGETHDLEGEGVVSLTRTETAGAYRVQADGVTDVPRAAFVVAAPAEESDLAPGDVPTPTDLAGSPEPDGPARRTPVGPWVFLVAGLVGLAEGLVRRRGGARGGGGAGAGSPGPATAA